MLHHTLLVLLLLLSLGFPAPLPAGAVTVLYVKPTEDTTCPGEPCHTLDEYAQNASQYFISDTSVEFLPGTHNLSRPLNISGVNNLSLVARNATRNETIIWLFEALWFTNSSNITLLGSMRIWSDEDMCTFIGFESVLHLKMSYVIFQIVSSTATGPGVIARNVFGNCTFEQIDFVSFVQQQKYFLVIFYDTDELYTPASSLLFRASLFQCGVQFIFSHLDSFVDITLENLSVSQTTNGALSIRGSTQALYAVTLRNVSFKDNLCTDSSHSIVTLSHAHNVTFIGSDFNKNNGSVIALDHSHNVYFVNCDVSKINSPFDEVIVIDSSFDVTFIDCEIFQNNGLYILNLDSSHSLSFINCDFSGNVGTYNDIVALHTSHIVTFIECDFTENSAFNNIVSLYTSHNVIFTESDFYTNYHASVIVNLVASHVTFIHCHFYENNQANDIVSLIGSHDVTFIHCNFTKNSGTCDDVMYLGMESHNVTFVDCNFSENNGTHTEDIITLNDALNVTFIDCNFFENNNNVLIMRFSYTVTFVNCNIYDNKGTFTDRGGNMASIGIIQMDASNNVTFNNCSFYDNSITPFNTVAYTLCLNGAKEITFNDCTFTDNKVTPVWAYNSDFTLSGTILFSNNTAYEGGALAFCGVSFVYISNNTKVTFHNNIAENVGGAVFVINPAPLTSLDCFLQFHDTNTSSQCVECSCWLPRFKINFLDNTAREGGNAIYGAYTYNCLIGPPYCDISELLNSSYFYFEPSLKSDLSMVSSDPTRVCLCESGKPNCALVFNSGPSYTHYPGEEFSISAAVVGDMFGTVAGSAYAQILSLSNPTLGELQHSQQTNSHECTELKYSLFSEPGLVVMAITATNIPVQNYPSNSTIQYILENLSGGHINYEVLTTPVYINITLLPCPLGFMLSGPPHPQCVCDTLLHGLDITCNITNQIIHRRGTVWVSSEDNGTKLMVSDHCPYGYCKPGDVDVSLEHPDTQCAFNHSGTLCGGCQPGLSLALGSPQCLDCSNNYLTLIILFALAGLALVFFIKVLNLTVAEGTLNGLIFYANVVQANKAVLFLDNKTSPINIFIAWLNLDFGITTCFFDGLDGYWKTWLQFVFPLYLWAIITLIIYLSHKFQSVAKILGNSSVPVLATLIFLSYTKLFRTVITALSLSFLEISDNSSLSVWSFDGNIEYLSGKHIPLFVVALIVLLFLWLPYTVLLLFEQCIQKVGNYRVRKWMLKLKPFLDAYFGPFRGEHRYWVGVLLVARVVLLLVFGLNSTNDPSVNLLAVITVAVLLLIHFPYDTHTMIYPNGTGKCIRFWGGAYYKKWYLSVLESSFILNLAMLAAGNLYILRSAGGNQTAVVYISVGIVFCQFIGITLCHSYNQLKTFWGKWRQRNEDVLQINRADYEPIPERQPVGLETDQWPPYRPMNQCREPLLEDEDN